MVEDRHVPGLRANGQFQIAIAVEVRNGRWAWDRTELLGPSGFGCACMIQYGDRPIGRVKGGHDVGSTVAIQVGQGNLLRDMLPGDRGNQFRPPGEVRAGLGERMDAARGIGNHKVQGTVSIQVRNTNGAVDESVCDGV